jgi:hypothetical protein
VQTSLKDRQLLRKLLSAGMNHEMVSFSVAAVMLFLASLYVAYVMLYMTTQ